MGIQVARNYGVTGIIDLNGPGTGELAPIINAKIEGFQAALAVGSVDITGPGDDFANRVYGANVGGNGSATGWIQAAKCPYEPATKGIGYIDKDKNFVLWLVDEIQNWKTITTHQVKWDSASATFQYREVRISGHIEEELGNWTSIGEYKDCQDEPTLAP